MKYKILLLLSITFVVAACNSKNATNSNLIPQKFDDQIDGKPVSLITLKNNAGMEVCITNFGGRIVSIFLPDKNGELRDVALGFDNIKDYENIPSDFGASIGRYANRINKGKFVLDGDTIQLPCNNFGHCLHGGPNGWQYKVYDVVSQTDSSLTLSLTSPDKDSNFPGEVIANVDFLLANDNAIKISYSAVSDKKTIINMTNHTYFNLSGNPSEAVTEDVLYLNADFFTPVDSTFMTTGEILPVENTPMDFTVAKKIGQDIDADYIQLKNGRGYDHNWVLNTAGDINTVAASLYCPASGIILEVFTTEPGIQVYSGNFLDGTVAGKNGITYQKHSAICLETQHYPDSPNKPNWLPSVVLTPERQYTSQTIYKFSTR
ncbi:MAG: galactose mutarotase [Bacteroidales bacterium]|nr:galactose mutarotase [Bacteroidales bacterium]MDD3151283.1 galactose mutarotase [Bacteroidales bacterium]MDD4633449.1 galactose mutarotase [Bacteroidales bacterium]